MFDLDEFCVIFIPLGREVKVSLKISKLSACPSLPTIGSHSPLDPLWPGIGRVRVRRKSLRGNTSSVKAEPAILRQTTRTQESEEKPRRASYAMQRLQAVEKES